MLSILYGLISAIGWGAADFTGGLASRQTNPYRVLFLAEAAGLLPLLVVLFFVGEPIPALPTWLWSTAASGFGTFGLLILYHALAKSQMTIAAPVSALLAAVVPVLIGSLTQGLPDPLTLLGFGLALGSIWMISQNNKTFGWQIRLRELRLPLLAGVSFGFYLVTMHAATRSAYFWPLVNSRLIGTLALLAYSALRRGPLMPERHLWPLVMLGGVLDVTGNAFYALSAQTGRMDVAAVLASIYPGSTVILAALLLKERISRLQMIGLGMALGAIILFTI